MKKSSIGSSFLLFLAAFIWGVAFVSQSKGMEFMGPFTFNGVRCTLGCLVLIPFILIRRGQEKKPTSVAQEIPWKVMLPGGILCGLLLTSATMLQQYGIMYTTVGKAGFITTLYIIIVPILGIFFKRRVPVVVWIGAVIAAIGMYLLCVTEGVSINQGDILVFGCAIIFSFHIMVVDYFSPKVDGVILSCIQFFISGVICSLGALLFETPTISQLAAGAVPLLYAGILSCGVAYTLQIVGQKNVNPTVAAMILSLEAVVSSIAGYVAFKVGFLTTDQTLSARQILGCVIVFAAVILVQLPIGRQAEKTE